MSSALIAECQARLNSTLQDIIDFFAASPRPPQVEEGETPITTSAAPDLSPLLSQRSLDLLSSFLQQQLIDDFLTLAEALAAASAYLPHDYLFEKLLNCRNLRLEGLNLEKKLINKRLRILREDKKSDPEMIIKQENLLNECERKKALEKVQIARLSVITSCPLSYFLSDEKIEGKNYYQSVASYLKCYHDKFRAVNNMPENLLKDQEKIKKNTSNYNIIEQMPKTFKEALKIVNEIKELNKPPVEVQT